MKLENEIENASFCDSVDQLTYATRALSAVPLVDSILTPRRQ